MQGTEMQDRLREIFANVIIFMNSVSQKIYYYIFELWNVYMECLYGMFMECLYETYYLFFPQRRIKRKTEIIASCNMFLIIIVDPYLITSNICVQIRIICKKKGN